MEAGGGESHGECGVENVECSGEGSWGDEMNGVGGRGEMNVEC